MTKGNFEFQSKLSIGDTMAENLKEKIEKIIKKNKENDKEKKRYN